MPPSTARVTVTLPVELVEEIDRVEANRSRFVAVAVEHEIERRRREGLLDSLRNPHPESVALAAEGVSEWGALAADGDSELVDVARGTPVKWVEGRGWVERKR
jgi:post-segregation antitoxin (ccd killing protein)